MQILAIMFAEFEIDKSDFEAFSRTFIIAKISIKKIFKKSVYEHFEKQLTEKLSLNNDSSKFFLYRKLKSDIKLEEYLKSDRNFKNRQLLTKFRLRDHNLEVEHFFSNRELTIGVKIKINVKK